MIDLDPNKSSENFVQLEFKLDHKSSVISFYRQKDISEHNDYNRQLNYEKLPTL